MTASQASGAAPLTQFTPDAVNRRLDLYETQTAPLIDHYSRRGALAVVNGVGHPDHVFKRLCDAVEARR